MTQIKTLNHENVLFEQAAELYTASPDLLILGSVARAALMGVDLDTHRPSGVMRDIDVVRIGDRTGPRIGEAKNVDYLFEDWIAEDGSYLVFPHDPTLNVAIKHPEVFQPIIKEVNGVYIPLPHPDVLGKISTMQHIQRPKDKRAMAEYNHYLAGVDKHLPDELLQPFDELKGVLSQRLGYVMRGTLRNGYHRTVPEPIRHNLHIGEHLNWMRRH